MKIARWWNQTANGEVHCTLCPRDCKIGEGEVGFCYIRKNLGRKLVALAYGRPAQILVDHVEHKPLHHFYPGTRVYSIGTAGCNMGCVFCRTWDSMRAEADQLNSTDMTPEDVCRQAIRHGCPAIAFTFNEPTIWGEYLVDIAECAHAMRLKTVIVTNGYVTGEAFPDIYRHIDAANVDLKALSPHFYRDLACSELGPVLATIARLKRETDVWFEITNVLIPGVNDARSEISLLIDWVLENVGDQVPLHFTAYHPNFQLFDAPHTPAETLERARETAIQSGLKYVYTGDLAGTSETRCPSCGRAVIRRSWHQVQAMLLGREGGCECGQRISGRYNYEELAVPPAETQLLPIGPRPASSR